VTTGRPLVFEPYAANRTTGSFILIDPATNFTAGAGMIVAALHEQGAGVGAGAAERLAAAARQAASEADAIAAVRAVLEEVLV
jgi:sulfate adenylyltransferase subunit 1 (EFTu-like GTPase family)